MRMLGNFKRGFWRQFFWLGTRSYRRQTIDYRDYMFTLHPRAELLLGPGPSAVAIRKSHMR